jgi:N-ethylmaleimide reductase
MMCVEKLSSVPELSSKATVAAMTSPTLLSKLSLGDLTLKNRVALASLTRGRSGRSQIPTAINAEYYVQRASVGLLISEGTIISPGGNGWAGAPAIYSEAHIDGWKSVNDAVHEKGGVIFCQLWHLGRAASSCFHGIRPVAASEIAADGRVTDYDGTKVPYEVPHALTVSEIADVVEEFRHAAKCALKAGFDGVEVHSANGYLLDVFLQSISNVRTDEYGGSFENRFRIVREVIAACQESFPLSRIGIKLSPNGAFNSMGSDDNFEAFSYFVTQLNQIGVGYVQVVDGLGFGFHNKCKQFKLADARKCFDGIIMGNCGYEQLTAEGALNTGAADMISFGRALISNPDLVERFENNWPLNPPADHTAFWWYPNFPDGDSSVGYTDFPAYKAE